MRKTRRQSLIKILQIISIIAIILSGFCIVFILKTEKDEVDLYDDLTTQVASVNDIEDIVDDTVILDDDIVQEDTVTQQGDAIDNPIDWGYLLSINPDTVAWVEIPDADIQYPVVYNDSDHYINYDFWNKKSKFGAIFSGQKMEDVSCSVLYGHNMRNGAMFGNLKKLYENETHDNLVTIYYPSGHVFVGKPFAFVLTKKDTSLYNIPVGVISSSYIDDIENQASNKGWFGNFTGNEIVVFSTCNGPQGTSNRLLMFVSGEVY